jgi:murein DD-endopeptidase MepM/ murein hydrolase activator NlpD
LSCATRGGPRENCKIDCGGQDFSPTAQAPCSRADADGAVRISPTSLPVCAAAVAAAALPAPALAAGSGGGVAAPDEAPAKAGGGRFAAELPHERRPRARRRGTLITSFQLRRRRLFLHGRAARVLFTLSGRRAVTVRLHVLQASDGSRVATLDLGERAPGDHSVAFTGAEAGVLPEGGYVLHLAGRGLRRGPTASSTAELDFSHHAFPLAGSFDWGGEGSRFGAPRHGHSHQGQDLAAAEGTPVVAPRAGVVESVQYQAEGAGHYVVLDDDDEDLDYVFMHLRSGSIPVAEGDHVRTGERIGEVGNTGRSSGPHLHFEIWVGGWFAGGEPIDPLPLLQAWAS